MRAAPTSVSGLFGLAIVLSTAHGPSLAADNWPQWGGPDRNFATRTTGLADSWPDDGPARLWRRELGSGYSAIVYDDGVLYTMYRAEPTSTTEHFVALEAATGRTIWDHANEAPYIEKPDERWGGHGPNATPLIVGDRLFAVGSRSVLHCFDKRSGRVLWKHDLSKEYGAKTHQNAGYCWSPIAHGNLIIVGADRQPPREDHDIRRDVPRIEARGHIDGHAIMAFDQTTGTVAWQSLDISRTFSSPILITVHRRMTVCSVSIPTTVTSFGSIPSAAMRSRRHGTAKTSSSTPPAATVSEGKRSG